MVTAAAGYSPSTRSLNTEISNVTLIGSRSSLEEIKKEKKNDLEESKVQIETVEKYKSPSDDCCSATLTEAGSDDV